ncbi:hypothetical protein LZ32DRAFT_435179 [Colletotrichum eremochloae]|nr:hypothetical protein LZ32DRAFT_435179 [Colletotrichum eremochloae]
MHASKVLFTSLSLIAGLVAADDVCCDRGTADIDSTCKNLNLSAFCCSFVNADIGSGCDRNDAFPVGRNINGSAPAGLACKTQTGGLPGFLGCASNN